MKNLIREQPTHDEIALAAYQLWEQRGHPQGCEVQFWLEAEQQMMSSGERSRQPSSALAQSPNALAMQVQPSQAAAKSAARGQMATQGNGKAKPAIPQPTVSPAPQTKRAARAAAH